MTTTQADSQSTKQPAVAVRIARPDGTVRACELVPDKLLVIGSSSGCGLRMEGPGIAGTHCMLSLIDGELHIRDWNSELGTYVNGERVDHQMVAQPGAEIRIGDYCLLTDSLNSESSAPPAASSSPALPTSPEPADEDDADLNSDRDDAEFGLDSDFELDAVADGPSSKMGDTWVMKLDDEDETVPLGDAPAKTSRALTDSGSYHYEDFADDTMELLKTEVELLRAELAERDTQLKDLEALAGSVPREEPDGDLPTAAEVDALANRLEQLLAELEQSDERLSTMSELLRVTEEANDAAADERDQMENWIAEIERRVGQRESEWQAERESLQKAVEELTEHRDRAEAQLASAAASGAAGEGGASDYIQRLRQEYTAMKRRLRQSEQERVRMNQRLEESGTLGVEQQVQTAVEESLREERLQLTQEKAALARERAELLRDRDNLEQERSRPSQNADSADHRIRAFREHLREIHQTEPRSPKNTSLSERLGKLWRKLDGRPLDTD